MATGGQQLGEPQIVLAQAIYLTGHEVISYKRQEFGAFEMVLVPLFEIMARRSSSSKPSDHVVVLRIGSDVPQLSQLPPTDVNHDRAQGERRMTNIERRTRERST